MRKSEVTKVLTMLSGAYPSANVTPETVMVYETMLSDLEAMSVVQAVIDHIATSKWFPSISELRERVFTSELRMVGADEILCRLHSGDELPDDTIGMRALNICGGQWSFKNSTTPDLWRKEYRATYNKLAAEAIEQRSRRALQQVSGRAYVHLLDE